MIYPQTDALERELAPVVAEEIRAARAEHDGSLSYATQAVARAWFEDAMAQGISWEAADDLVRYVHQVGAEMKRSRSG